MQAENAKAVNRFQTVLTRFLLQTKYTANFSIEKVSLICCWMFFFYKARKQGTLGFDWILQ